jgi:hypothetical protein
MMRRISLLGQMALFCLVINARAQDVSLEWAGQMGGPENDYGWSIDTDASGNVFLTGFFGGTADFDPGSASYNLSSAGKNDLFIAKLDPDGGFAWAKKIGGPEEDRGIAVAVDQDGNVLVTGYFGATVDFDPGPGTVNLTSDYPLKYYLLKLTGAGDFVWVKSLESTNCNSEGSGVGLDGSGNIYVNGTFDGSPDFDPGAGTAVMTSLGMSDCFVIKYSPAGAFLWTRQMGGEGSEDVYDIEVDNAGNIYTAGYFVATADFDPGTGTHNLTAVGNADLFVSKLDADGNFAWAFAAGGQNNDYASSLAVDGTGNVYLTGPFQGTVDFDPGSGVVNLTSAGTRNVFILKLDPAGRLAWAKMFTGTGTDYAYSILTDPQGRVFVTGGFKGTTDFDPGSGTTSLSTAGDYDFFMAKLSSTGNLLKIIQLGNTGYEIAQSMAMDTEGVIYATGYFSGTADFDSGAGVHNLASNGKADCFVLKMSQDLSGIDEQPVTGMVRCHPNPTSGLTNLTTGGWVDRATVRIYDSRGMMIRETTDLSGDRLTVDLAGLAPGIYIVELREPYAVKRTRVVKQ